jgi:succinate dehydrogenase hydrophobic anchor subunit
MQDPENYDTRKRTHGWFIARIAAVIGIFLLLAVFSYMAYVAIDDQASHSSSLFR